MDSERYQRDTQQNAKTIESEIRGLNNFIGIAGGVDYKGFWERVKYINTLLNDLRPTTREDLNRLRSQMSDFCKTVKSTMQNERETLARYSREKRNMAMERINQARGYTTGGPEDLTKASELLKEAIAIMKNGWDGIVNLQTEFVKTAFGNEGRLTKEDREECWDAYVSAQDNLRSCRQSLYDFHYGQASSAVSAAVEAANHSETKYARELIKEAQQVMKNAYLQRDQRQRLRDDLNRAWDIVSSRIEEKTRQWRQRQEDGIAILEGALEKAENAADRVRQNISNNESKLYGNCSDSYRDRVEGWISEGHTKLSDIESSISSLGAKIQDARSRLNQS